MKDANTTNLAAEKAEPLGDTGDGDAGVREGEQGISNRPGDEAEDDDDEFNQDLDELDDEQEDDGAGPDSKT